MNDAVVEQLVEETIDPRRFFYLRPSGFPFCGLRKILDAAERDLTRIIPFSMAYYTSVGHTVHDVFQRYLGKAKHIVGDWYCPRCKDTLYFTFQCKCKVCKTPREYRELEVLDKRGLVGHLDGLFFDKVTGLYWVIDYKTTSMGAVYGHRKKPKFRTNSIHIRSKRMFH